MAERTLQLAQAGDIAALEAHLQQSGDESMLSWVQHQWNKHDYTSALALVQAIHAGTQ